MDGIFQPGQGVRKPGRTETLTDRDVIFPVLTLAGEQAWESDMTETPIGRDMISPGLAVAGGRAWELGSPAGLKHIWAETESCQGWPWQEGRQEVLA